MAQRFEPDAGPIQTPPRPRGFRPLTPRPASAPTCPKAVADIDDEHLSARADRRATQRGPGGDLPLGGEALSHTHAPAPPARLRPARRDICGLRPAGGCTAADVRLRRGRLHGGRRQAAQGGGHPFRAGLRGGEVRAGVGRASAAAQRIADGERNIRLETWSRSELGMLARAVDRMREKLEGKAYVEEMATNLSHELKTPLAAIRGSAEVLEGEVPREHPERGPAAGPDRE